MMSPGRPVGGQGDFLGTQMIIWGTQNVWGTQMMDCCLGLGIDIIHGTGLETAHAIMTSHFHPHLPGTFGVNKMASICVVSSNCLNYPRQCFEGIVSFNQLEQRLYFTIVQKTHPIPPYKFCSSYTKNRNFLTAKILFKIITALIVRYSKSSPSSYSLTKC